VLEAERAHRAPRRIRWPLRDRETDTRINRVEAGHASNIEAKCHHQRAPKRHRSIDAAPPAPLVDSGHVTLHDTAYNAERHIGTGNPYKELIARLMSRGMHVELCGATARIHHWGNEDLLPGIKVNTDAGVRMIQLVPQRFVKITE